MVAENVTNICCLTEVKKGWLKKERKEKANVTKSAPLVYRGIAHVFSPDPRHPKAYDLA